MLKKTLLVSLILTILTAGMITVNAGVKESEAVKAAERWLTLVDKGDYSESWENAADYFKNSVTKDKWLAAMVGTREPLGKLNSRKPQSATYYTSLPGAPDGEYVVVQFLTSFENKRSAVETITPMLDKRGKWKVSGYYIR